jgi:ArsR family transcriptional regulator
MPTVSKEIVKSKTRPWPQQMTDLLKACADQTRLRLLNLLTQEGEICVCYLVDVLGVSQPTVSRHLAYLKRAGLVADRKDGLWVHYRLSASLNQHAHRILECLSACCAEVPEMQSDIAKLRQVCAAQPIVRLTSRRSVTTPPQQPAFAKKRAGKTSAS